MLCPLPCCDVTFWSIELYHVQHQASGDNFISQIDVDQTRGGGRAVPDCCKTENHYDHYVFSECTEKQKDNGDRKEDRQLHRGKVKFTPWIGTGTVDGSPPLLKLLCYAS